jgi:hypothetical protein
MNIFDKLLKKQSAIPNQLDIESPGKLMLMGILTSSTIIFDDAWTDYKKRKGQTFELIILSTLLILRKFREIRPQYYIVFEEDFFKQIQLFAIQEQIIQMLPVDFANFINSRFILYDDEFSYDDENQVKLPGHTAYNLFERPLLKNSGLCEDLFKLMELQIKFQSYYKQLMLSLDFMISKKYA